MPRPARRPSRARSRASIPRRSSPAPRWRRCRSRASRTCSTCRRRHVPSAASLPRGGASRAVSSRAPARSTSRKVRGPTTGALRARCSRPDSAPGHLVHNCFSYHFTPAGSMAETGRACARLHGVPGGDRPDRAAGAGDGRPRRARLRRHAVVPQDHPREGRRARRGAAVAHARAGVGRSVPAEPARCPEGARRERLPGLRDRRRRPHGLRNRGARGPA